MSMLVSLVQEGDIIVVDKPDRGVNIEGSRYYIMKENQLVEVPWYEASEYQNAYYAKRREESEASTDASDKQ